MGVFGGEPKVSHTETNRALPDVDKDAEMNGTRGRSMVAEVKTKNTISFWHTFPSGISPWLEIPPCKKACSCWIFWVITDGNDLDQT